MIGTHQYSCTYQPNHYFQQFYQSIPLKDVCLEAKDHTGQVSKEDREQREAIRSAGQKPQPLTAGVPVAIFVNKKTGKVEARRGTSETATLDYIFK